MIEAIEVQVISRLLVTEDESEVDTLIAFDETYYRGYLKEIRYIHNHYARYNTIPSRFDFMVEFDDFNIVNVPEPLEYLVDKMRDYKKYLILMETFNTIKDLGEGDLNDAWRFLEGQCEKAASLDNNQPMDIVKEAKKRADQVVEYSKQKRIPTGFPEIDKVMYGGLSTVEELLVLIARTNAGKSWVCTKMMESAQQNGFPVAYYSPEMQAAYLATRFDTWRGHFENNQLFKGNYSAEYYEYIKGLKEDDTYAFVIEDKDFPDGVSVRTLDPFIKKHGIKLLVIDGISYMTDDKKATRDQEKYKNIATGLFTLSKKYGCAVVLVMQANREVKTKDDKGESIPDLFNAEGSDQPGRVATQAFGIRQIFDKHVLDIKLLKSRMANNENPVFSYSWNINTGNMNYIEGGSDSLDTPTIVPQISPAQPAPILTNTYKPDTSNISLIEDDDDVEF